MKKIALGLLCLFATFQASAQELPKQQEIGITFSDLDSFGITYRVGTKKALWRFGGVSTSGRNETSSFDSTDRTISSHGFTLTLGREYRKQLENNFELRYGADLGFGYQVNKNKIEDNSADNRDEEFKTVSYSSRVFFVLGMNYALSEKLILGAELRPNVAYNIGSSKSETAFTGSFDDSRSGFSYNLSSNSALLSLMYKF